MISTKIYDKQDAFNFEKVNFPFIDGDVPHSPHMVYTFHNSFVLQGYVVMLMIDTIDSIKHFLNFITNTQS